MSNDQAPDRGAILAQLQRILDSADFDASGRNKRFLSYIVERALDGEAERIKAFTIATSVFGRNSDFDAQVDPIVRIEASRLRRALERYYLIAGRDDAVRIAIPKGSYVPTFEVSGEAPPIQEAAVAPSVNGHHGDDRHRSERFRFRPAPLAVAVLAIVVLGLALVIAYQWLDSGKPNDVAATVPAAPSGPTILVMSFADENYDRHRPELGRAFTREIVAGLTRFNNLNVHAARGSESTDREAESKTQTQIQVLGANFVVTGGISVSTDRVRVLASLADARTGRYLWSEGFEEALAPAEIFKIQREISQRIVQVLAQRYGVIFAEAVKELRGRPPGSLTSYDCVVGFYHYYWRRASVEHFSSTRECLERTVREEPDYAEALSSLALLYIDAYRVNMDRGALQFEPLPRALQLARRAIDLSPEAAHGYRALYLTYWMMNDVPRSLEAGDRALSLNPNDTEIVADVGMRFCLAGNWEKGFPLVKSAFIRNPALPDQYRFPLALRHFIDGEYPEALDEARKINLPDVVYTHVMMAVSYARLGRAKEAAQAVSDILKVFPAYGDHAYQDLRRRNLHPDVVQSLVEGLRAAGLRIKPVS